MVIVYFFVIAFTETRAYALFQTPDFLNLSESMVRTINTFSLGKKNAATNIFFVGTIDYVQKSRNTRGEEI